MKSTITISEGQNPIDFVLQEYGSAEALFEWMADNPNRGINDVLLPGEKLVVDSAKVVSLPVKQFYQRQGQRVNTGDLSYDLEFIFDFEDAGQSVTLRFVGDGNGKIFWGDGASENFTVGQTINHEYLSVSDNLIRVQLSDKESITEFHANDNAITSGIDLTVLSNLQLAELHGNAMGLPEIQETLNHLLDGSPKSGLIVSLYGNTNLLNETIRQQVLDLEQQNIFIELPWLEAEATLL